jgi:hypothetical protein
MESVCLKLWPTYIKKENMMTTKAGLWIDHRKAIIVAITDKGVETSLTVSGAERQLRRSGDSPLKGPYDARSVPAEKTQQRAFSVQLKRYYDAVIACIGDAENILIFGPGKAKGELKKRLEDCGSGARIARVETEDKMTDRQIAAKVQKYFAK